VFELEIVKLIDELDELVRHAGKVPLFGKCTIDREEALELIKEMRIRLPADMKSARKIIDERQRILSEAQKEASDIIAEAENKRMELIDKHQITSMATEQARETIDIAQKKAKDMKMGSRDYVASMLTEYLKFLQDKVDEVNANLDSIK